MIEMLDERYKILEEIGEGGMAIVYKAEDTVLERMVAVKVLRPEYASDPKFVARLQQEARSAGSLSHPNIVNIYDVGENQGVHFIVMELVEGRSLKEIISSEGPLSPARAVNIATQICSALAFAHLKQIVHRDIKPQNILITGDERVKLTDFGIAHALASGVTSHTGQVLGSVHYFSPEQAKGDSVNELADVYSTGVVLFEMLTGGLPFDGESVVGIALKHIQEQPPSIRELNARVPLSLEHMVIKAMAKAPGERFPSAREFEKALRNYLQVSDQQTSAFKPLKGTEVVPPASRALQALPATVMQASVQPARVPTAKKSGGFDWILLALSVTTFFFVLGLVVVGAAVYRAYAVPAGSPTVQPISPASRAVDRVVVPGVERLDLQVARYAVESQGLRLEVTGEDFSPEIAKGKVLSQNPQQSELLTKGDTVYVVTSKGAETIKVPTVNQMKFVDAASKLKADGFEVEKQEEWNNKVAQGMVFKQQPEGGKESKLGAKVIVTVSKGEEKAIVPNVIGMPEQKAKELIEKARLKNSPWVNYQGRAELPENVLKGVPIGGVLSIDPAAGSEVSFGTEVMMAVRKE